MKGTSKGRVRRTASLVAMFVMVLSIMAPGAASGDEHDQGNSAGKVTICHATGSESNPYELITVSVNAVIGGGHGDHEGDIIPAFENDGESFDGQHWTADGQALLAAGCVVETETDPDEVDVCPNIDGVQADVPEGMELVDDECVLIVVEPTDVCPNIDGVQADVPAGMELVDGACVDIVVEPTDVCPNLEGDQAEVPAGMELVGDACVEVDTGPDEVEQQMVTICHATASDTNPYNLITVSVNAIIGGGHGDHEGDIIPAFEYTVEGETQLFPGQSLGEGEAILAANCVVEVDTGPDETDVCPNIEGIQAEVPEGMELVGDACVEVDTGPDEVEQQMVTICHATASDTNPYNLITVSVNAIIGGGHGDHEGDIIPAFEYTVEGETQLFPGQNLGEGEAILAANCVVEVDTGPDEVDLCPNLEGDQAELPEGYLLVDGECVVIEIQCPEGAELVDGVCVIDAVECPEGAELVDGVCVIDAVECPEGAEPVDGVCVVDVECPEGSTLIDGDCVIDAVECPEGATLVGDVCVIDAVACPAGAELVDDVCVVDVVCPEGSTLTDGECVIDAVVGGEVIDRGDGDDGDVDGDVDAVVGGEVIDRGDGDDGDIDAEEVVVVVPSERDTEVLGVTQTRGTVGAAQLARTGPATLPLLVAFSLLSLLFGLRLRTYGRTARASK